MKIRLKTVCPEYLGNLPDGEYEVADGCTAQQALTACMETAGASPLSREQMAQLIFMRNGSHMKAEAPICAGDRLIILRPLTGG